MNVLFIESSIDPSRGGIQRVSYSLFDYFESHGISCYFAYYLVGYDKLEEERKLCFHPEAKEKELLDTFSEFVSKNKIEVIILQGICHRGILNVMNSLRRMYHCKLIYCLHQTPGYYQYIKQSLRPKPLLMRLLTGKTYAQRAELRAFNIVDKYVLLSQSYVPYFCKLYGVGKTDKLDYIENPLPFVDRNEKFTKEKTVLIVARFSEIQKNLKTALRIWKKVEATAVKYNWKLQLAGYGDDESMILEYATSLNLKNFFFLGKANNPVPLYEKASIFIMTSFFEGLPMTLLESMSMECVPIAFNSFKSLPDIIDDNINGFVVPAFDEEEFAQKMRLLMEDEALRQKMSISAREASERFSIKSVGGKWLDLLGELA